MIVFTALTWRHFIIRYCTLDGSDGVTVGPLWGERQHSLSTYGVLSRYSVPTVKYNFAKRCIHDKSIYGAYPALPASAKANDKVSDGAVVTHPQ